MHCKTLFSFVSLFTFPFHVFANSFAPREMYARLNHFLGNGLICATIRVTVSSMFGEESAQWGIESSCAS